MNEIEKLKTEHARYRKALEKIHTQYGDESDAYYLSDTALNPPPSAPVTLDELKSALRQYKLSNGSHSVNFYQDESGSIRNGFENRVFSFSTLREAVDFLTT